MKYIAITEATYAKLLRAGELTHQDPEAWAEIVLFRMASEMARIVERDKQGLDALAGSSGEPPDCANYQICVH